MGWFHFSHVIACYNNNFKYFQRFKFSKSKNAIVYEIYIWSEEERGKK